MLRCELGQNVDFDKFERVLETKSIKKKKDVIKLEEFEIQKKATLRLKSEGKKFTQKELERYMDKIRFEIEVKE